MGYFLDIYKFNNKTKKKIKEYSIVHMNYEFMIVGELIQTHSQQIQRRSLERHTPVSIKLQFTNQVMKSNKLSMDL